MVWQKGMDLVLTVYEICKEFPKEELYGIHSQIKRSALSIPSNIAEGSSRRSTNEFIRFINIATGSLAELETQMILANRLHFLSNSQLKEFSSNADELSRMLQGLYNSLLSKSKLQNTRLSTPDSNH
jgi:four helix bundle protein